MVRGEGNWEAYWRVKKQILQLAVEKGADNYCWNLGLTELPGVLGFSVIMTLKHYFIRKLDQ